MKKIIHRRSAIALAIASALPVLAWAQQPVHMDDIVISATRFPGGDGLSSTGAQAAQASSADTGGLLRSIPGVTAYGAGGVSSLPVIQGLGDDRLRLQTDGMDRISSCANHMNPALSYIDPSHVESVEVYAGATPVSVGGDSIGGTIRVNSRAPRFSAAGGGLSSSGRLGGFYRSNGDAWGVNLAADLATEDWFFGYTGATVRSGDYEAARDFKPGMTLTNTVKKNFIPGDLVASSAFQSDNHQVTVATRRDKHLLELKLGLQDIPYQGFTNQRMDMTANRSETVNLRHEADLSWGKLETRLYGDSTRHKMNFLDDKMTTANNAAGMPMDTYGKTAGVQVKAEMALSGRDTLRTGAELQRYRLDDYWDPVSAQANNMMGPNTFWNIRDGERDRLDGFGEWEAKWDAKWQTTLGLRLSQIKMDTGPVQAYNTSVGNTHADYAGPVGSTPQYTAFNNRDRARTDTNVDFSALSRFTPAQGESIEVGYARKVRSPNLYERYTWSTNNPMVMSMINWFGDGNGYVGNLDLKPETAHTLSYTAKWEDARGWRLSVAPYYTYIENYIGAKRCSGQVAAVPAFPCGPTNQTFNSGYVFLQFANQTAEIYGATVSGSKELGKAEGYGVFRLQAVLDVTRGRNRTLDDNLYNIMPANLKLTVEQKSGGWTNSLENHLVAGKDRVSQEQNELKTGGYSVFNWRTSHAWKQWRVDVGVDNLLNKFYYEPLGGMYMGQRYPTPAASAANNFQPGLYTLPYGTQVPGMGRSAYLAASLKF